MIAAVMILAVWLNGMPVAWVVEDRSYRRWMQRSFPLSWAEIQRGEAPMRNGIDHVARIWAVVLWPMALLSTLIMRKAL